MTHNSQTLGPTFSLPEGRWFWLEVHQRLSQANPLSEVFVDGRPVSSSVATNNNPDTDGAPVWLKVGFVSLCGQPASVFVDRTSVSLNQRGPLGAPLTPTAFSGTEQDKFLTMYWQGSLPPGGGFRVYRQNPDGTWSLRFNNVTTNGLFDNTGLLNCTRYNYRVSAFDATGRESAVSQALELMPRSSSGC